MRGAALGWTIAGAVVGIAAGVVAGVAAANREARERMSASARVARQRMTAEALEVQRRLADARQDVRDTAEHLREQGRESFGRALLQAAEARDASLDDSDDEPDEPASRALDPDIAEWMVGQRWFAGKGAAATLRVLGTLELPADDPAARIQVLFVLDENATAPALYQVPLVTRSGTAEPEPGAVVRRSGDQVLVDGPRDRAYVEALLGLVLGGGTAGDGAVAATGVPLERPGTPPTVTGARVLSGEQSNTSIVLELAADDQALPPLIVKVFRTLHHGDNPDVVLQSAISAAGSDRVPGTVGALTGRWPDAGRIDGVASGHLAVAQEFLPGTEDAWRVALVAARDGRDFRDAARELGEATAEVHRILADRFDTADATDDAKAGLLTAMETRAEQAAELVPELAERTEAIAHVLGAAAGAPWPALQRVHGDYHLGQVLLVPGRGWVLLDFEGEPLRPMAERSAPDLPLRDVAGMLRSFDYVAGTIAREGGDATAWAEAAREAFLAGYDDGAGGLDRNATVLAALELDKALYECRYEALNRPDWLPIPRDAVLRLLDAPTTREAS